MTSSLENSWTTLCALEPQELIKANSMSVVLSQVMPTPFYLPKRSLTRMERQWELFKWETHGSKVSGTADFLTSLMTGQMSSGKNVESKMKTMGYSGCLLRTWWLFLTLLTFASMMTRLSIPSLKSLSLAKGLPWFLLKSKELAIASALLQFPNVAAGLKKPREIINSIKTVMLARSKLVSPSSTKQEPLFLDQAPSQSLPSRRKRLLMP